MTIQDDGCEHYVLTSAELADLHARLAGPKIRLWKRTMTREQYLLARAKKRSKADITLHFFNNDPRELGKQLKEWGLDPEREEQELRAMGKVAKAIDLTREQYLQRRAGGEGRMRIGRSLGIETKRFYELLSRWGIRDIEVEEREIERLRNPVPAEPRELDQRVAQELENKSELRESGADDAIPPADPELQEEPQDDSAGQLRELEARYEYDKVRTIGLEEDIDRLVRGLESKEKETKHLKDALEKATEVATHASARIRELEGERQLLLATIEAAAAKSDSAEFVTIQIPIMPATKPIAGRVGIYSGIELFVGSVEAAELDRERVMRELFDLLQRVVNYVSADLTELLPGRDDVQAHVHHFFREHNRQWLNNLPEQEAALR